jgi:hypothetical protein
VALFHRKSGRLVVGIPTDARGQFKFANIAAGKYVFVVSASGLHNIVIPVAVAGNTRATSFNEWELLLHLRSEEDRKQGLVTPITQPRLRAELLKLVREDKAIRDEIIQHGADRIDESLEARMLRIDTGNTARLKAIVKRYGWPGPELVGADGAAAAFTLVQHSPDVAFEQAMLPRLRRSYEGGKLSAWDYALLVDRVLVRTGKSQRYGMSLERWSSREPVLSPIEDEANVDKRRAKLGLPPLRDYLEFMKRLYFPEK